MAWSALFAMLDTTMQDALGRLYLKALLDWTADSDVMFIIFAKDDGSDVSYTFAGVDAFLRGRSVGPALLLPELTLHQPFSHHTRDNCFVNVGFGANSVWIITRKVFARKRL